MRKTASLIIGVILIASPLAANAQASGNSNATLVALLQQMIVILTKELNQLIAQRAATQTASAVVATGMTGASGTSTTKGSTTFLSLPNGAIVEVGANGDIVRTIKEAPQQTYIAPAPTTQNQQTQTPAQTSAPASRTLSVSSPLDGIPEWHTPINVQKVAIMKFRLTAGGNTETHISKIRVGHFQNIFPNMWVEADDSSTIGTKVNGEVYSDGSGNLNIPLSASIGANSFKDFTIYGSIPGTLSAGYSSAIIQMYLVDVLSDAGGAFGLPLTGPALKIDMPAQSVAVVPNPTPAPVYSDAACLEQKKSLMPAAEAMYESLEAQRLEARKQACLSGCTDNTLSAINVYWELQIRDAMASFYPQMTQCSPGQRRWNDASQIISSSY